MAFLNVLKRIKERKERTVVSRSCIKNSLMKSNEDSRICLYRFYFFGQPHLYCFINSGLKLLKEKSPKMLPKMKKMKHKVGLRAAERMIIFEIASQFK